MSKHRVTATVVAAVLMLSLALLANLGATASADESRTPATPATPAAPITPLGADCSKSTLTPHTGFQIAPACVSTAFGEVTDQARNASLLIVDAPRQVRVGEGFTLKVSTRNLVRDRFLAAGAGGYYKESAFLNAQGLTRGHFHTACRLIADKRNAPVSERNPIFVATEDGKGSATPDTVSVRIAGGFASEGLAQCASWAGDGSHRIPMMQFANQIPAFDVVRIKVSNDRHR